MEYFSTFLTGFGNIVTKELKKQIPDTKIQVLLDGLIVFTTAQPEEKISNLQFLNNSFVSLKYIKESELEKLLKEIDLTKLPETKAGFNIIYSKENQTEKMSGRVFDKFREELGRILHSSLSPQGRLEFWIIERSEGFIFLGLRIKSGQKPYLEKGQLRSELSYMMCLLSDPSTDDIFLDPFAGSGALAEERLKFPFQKILAGDLDGKLAEELKERSKDLKLPITVGKWDALNLESFANGSINKIVTDPPWGIHLAKHLDLQMFYSKMLKEFFRILKPNGILVILVSNKELLEKLIRELKLFKLEEKYSTLVSGQKAGVFRLKRV